MLGQLDVHLDDVGVADGDVLVGEDRFVCVDETPEACFDLGGCLLRISLSSRLICLASSSPLAVVRALMWGFPWLLPGLVQHAVWGQILLFTHRFAFICPSPYICLSYATIQYISKITDTEAQITDTCQYII